MGTGFRRHRPRDRHRPDRRSPSRHGRGRHSARAAGPSEAPLLHRPTTETPKLSGPLGRPASRIGWASRAASSVSSRCPDLCSRAWIWDQYDSPGRRPDRQASGPADAAVVQVDGAPIALALTTDCTPRYCAADAEAGGRQAVAEAWRNLTAVGARPLAVTDNMNFGNPEKPEIMGQFAAAIRGIAAACEALELPGRERQCQPLQRDEWAGDPADARSSAASASSTMPPRRWASRFARGSTWCWSARRAAGSASRCGCARSPGARTAPRRRSICAPNARRAISCAPRSPRATCAPATTCPMAGCWSPSPRWRWRACTGARLSTGPRDIPGHAFWFGEDQGRYLLAVADCGRAGARRRGCRVASHADRHVGRGGFDTAGRRNHIRRGVARRPRRGSSAPGWNR